MQRRGRPPLVDLLLQLLGVRDALHLIQLAFHLRRARALLPLPSRIPSLLIRCLWPRRRRELTPFPDRPTVFVEDKRDRRQEARHARDQRPAPAHAQRIEHVLGEERGGGAARGAADGIRRQRARGVHEVGVGEVVEVGDENQQDGSGEEDAGEGGHDPGDGVVFGAPREPEHGEGEQNAAQHGHGEAVFGRLFVAGQDPFLDLAGVVEDVGAADAGADDGPQERELADARVPVPFLLEDDGVDGEEHVEEGVDDGQVDGDQEGDGVEEDGPRPRERDSEDAHERAVRRFDRGLDVLVSGHSGVANASGFVEEDLRREGFRDGDDQQHRAERQPDEDVEIPPPVLGQLQEAGHHRPQRGADEGHHAEDGHGVTALDGAPDVGQHAGRVAEGGAGEGAGEEAAGEQAAEVGREGAEEVEGEVAEERGKKDPSAAVELAQGRPDQRARAISEQEQRDDQPRCLHRDV